MADGGVKNVSGQPPSPPVDSTGATDQAPQATQKAGPEQTKSMQPRDQFERVQDNQLQNLTQNQLQDLSPQELERTYTRIRELMTRSITDPAISDADVSKVTQLLDRLSPEQYRQTLQRMDQDGVLAKYITEMEPEHRQAFLQQAARKGYVQTVALPPAPRGWGNPPNPPIPYRNDPNLPAPIRQAIHDQTVDGLNRYNRAYGRYMERYRQAVENSPTVTDIRRMGPPARYFYREHPGLIEPGVTRSHPDYQKFLNDRIDRWDSSIDMSHLFRIHHEIANKVSKLNGRRPAGDVWFKAQITRKGAQMGIRLSSERGVELENPAFTQSTRKGPFEVGGEIATGGQVKGSVRIGPKDGPGAQVSTDGNVELTGPKIEEVQPYAFYNPTNQEFGEGVKIGMKGTELQFEIGMRGISPEEVRAAIDPSSLGFFDIPPELNQGIHWNDLPESTRNHYHNILGWTEEEWNAALAQT